MVLSLSAVHLVAMTTTLHNIAAIAKSATDIDAGVRSKLLALCGGEAAGLIDKKSGAFLAGVSVRTFERIAKANRWGVRLGHRTVRYKV